VASIDGVPATLDQLHILTDASLSTGVTPKSASRFTLPVDVAIVLPPSTVGPAHVRVDGYLQGQLLGVSGTAELPIPPPKHVSFILAPVAEGGGSDVDLSFVGSSDDLAGAGGGGGGAGGGADLACGTACPTSATVALSASTQSMKLNDTQQLTVTVTPVAGYSGNVQLTASGVPAGVMATFANPTLAVNAAPAMTTLTLATASNTVTFADRMLTVTAASPSGSPSSTALSLTVTPELLVFIPNGVDVGTAANPNKNAFGPYGMQVLFVAPGTKITFVNNDVINHEIHADGTLGIAHEPGPLTAGGGTYTQTFNGTGPFNFYCHIHANMQGQINVQ
jgi:plastocyanin